MTRWALVSVSGTSNRILERRVTLVGWHVGSREGAQTRLRRLLASINGRSMFAERRIAGKTGVVPHGNFWRMVRGTGYAVTEFLTPAQPEAVNAA